MAQLIWQRMNRLALQDRPGAVHFQDPQAVANGLQASFSVLDVGAFGGEGGLVAPAPFQLSSSTLAYGELAISTFVGTALHSHLCSESLAFFVLPGRGIGH